MIEIDGSAGEGGGQVVRSSLTLAVMTGQPVHIANVRARRAKPGLQPQHLTAVRAAAQISGAHVEGAEIGSADLVFRPAGLFPGHYRVDIGTAGSTSLVLQTVFLPLALPRGPVTPAAAEPRAVETGAESTLMLIGGTHVPWSPCFHYLDVHWMAFMSRLGCDADLEMLLAGFFPQGQGQMRATIRSAQRLAPLDLPERGALKAIRGISGVANLDMTIAERQRKQAMQRLQGRHGKIEIECIDMPARSKGTFLLLLAEFRYSTACYFGLGALGKRAEQVADEACLWLERFLAGTGAVDEYLADQLLLPLAFADGDSRFRTARVTQHLLTHAEIIRAFGAAEITIEEDAKGVGLVRVAPSA